MRSLWMVLLLVMAGCVGGAPQAPVEPAAPGPEPWESTTTWTDNLEPGAAVPLAGIVPGSGQAQRQVDIPAQARQVEVAATGRVALFLQDPQGNVWCAVKTGRCAAPVINATGAWTVRVVSLAPTQQTSAVTVHATSVAPLLGEDGVTGAVWPVHIADRRGGEPTLAVTPDGSVMVVAGNDVLRLGPDGTWYDVTPPIDDTIDVTLDPFLVGDPVTGKVYVSQLATCQRISWTQDGGQAWTSQPLGCGGPDQHHQKLAVGPTGPVGVAFPRALHMMTMNLATWLATDEVILSHAVSFDDGRTWQQNPAMVPAVHGLEARAIGNIAISDDTSVHAVAYLCDAFNGAPYEGIGHGVSRDIGAAWTWQKIAPGGGTCQGIDPGIAVRGDEVHVVGWDASAGEQRLWHIQSGDIGTTWSEPFAIPTAGLRSFVLADLAASEDRLAAVFLATPDSGLGPNEVEGWARWYPYVAIHDGTGWSVQRLEDHPVQLGRICMEGPTCLGSSRNLLDFLDVQFGPDGRIHTAYVDGCLDECTQAWQSRDARLRVAIEPSLA